METGRVAKVLALVSTLAAVLFAPAVPSVGESGRGGTLCATGTCCPERNAVCNAGGGNLADKYYKAEGKCFS